VKSMEHLKGARAIKVREAQYYRVPHIVLRHEYGGPRDGRVATKSIPASAGSRVQFILPEGRRLIYCDAVVHGGPLCIYKRN
jgi:hypothetical protein